MSKNHRENRKPAYADWTVRTTGMVEAVVTGATFTRDECGGYTFTDLLGIRADFPPGTVLHVMRKDDAVWPLGTPEPLEYSPQLAELQGELDPRA